MSDKSIEEGAPSSHHGNLYVRIHGRASAQYSLNPEMDIDIS
jgi:hypothetical protein